MAIKIHQAVLKSDINYKKNAWLRLFPKAQYKATQILNNTIYSTSSANTQNISDYFFQKILTPCANTTYKAQNFLLTGFFPTW
jgi:hypothetical protein